MGRASHCAGSPGGPAVVTLFHSILAAKVRSPVTGGHVFTLDTKLDKESEFVRFGPGIKVSFSPL